MSQQPEYQSLAHRPELLQQKEPAWLWDIQSGTIKWANRKAIEFWGEQSLDVLCGQTFDHAMPGLSLVKSLGRMDLPPEGIEQQFLFWTITGPKNIKCLCRKVEFDNGLKGLLLNAREPEIQDKKPIAGNSVPVKSEPGRTDATTSTDQSTIAEIASLIKNRIKVPGEAANENIADEKLTVEQSSSKRRFKDDELLQPRTEFLAKVSHEVRTPLNSIIGFSEIMKDESFGPIGNIKYKGYLEDIHSSAQHALSLINDLLDITKINSGEFDFEPVPLDVNIIIEQCVSAMQPQAQTAKILIRSSLLPERPHINADKRSFKQILFNLLSNSLKFTDPGGQIILSTQHSPNGGLTIRVQDTGMGMSDDDIKTAMQPFKQLDTTHRRHDGTGLGLPLTKAMVEANNATFKIESKTNEGTRVDITFPKSLCI